MPSSSSKIGVSYLFDISFTLHWIKNSILLYLLVFHLVSGLNDFGNDTIFFVTLILLIFRSNLFDPFFSKSNELKIECRIFNWIFAPHHWSEEIEGITNEKQINHNIAANFPYSLIIFINIKMWIICIGCIRNIKRKQITFNAICTSQTERIKDRNSD